MFDSFFGNAEAQRTLAQMIASGRIPQTILLDGPEGVGKATLARRFASRILNDTARIEADDLSRADNAARIAEREKWKSEDRNDDPLLFSTHPDFVTFAPDGPLRQISIEQMRAFRERAQFKPLHGARRVFLIDRFDRANEQAANSLLKTLEEPPEHLIVFLTAENAYDLLPTIRSRSVSLRLAPLTEAEIDAFLRSRDDLADRNRRKMLANGSPGLAVSLDLTTFDRRRTAMLALLEAGSGVKPFGAWVKHSEAVGAARSEKLDEYLRVLYQLLEDVLLVANGLPPRRNADIAPQLTAVAKATPFAWIRAALKRTDELVDLTRRNIQKSVALDAFVIDLQKSLSRSL